MLDTGGVSYPSGSHKGSQLCAGTLDKGAFSQQDFRCYPESRNAQKYLMYLAREARFAEIREDSLQWLRILGYSACDSEGFWSTLYSQHL